MSKTQRTEVEKTKMSEMFMALMDCLASPNVKAAKNGDQCPMAETIATVVDLAKAGEGCR